jgi:cytochrome c oxidase subunit IV
MSDGHSIETFKRHIKVYIGVFVALLVLTVVTVGASYLHLGKAAGITLALIIAIIKASLVAGYFMHLNAERVTIYRVLMFTAIFFVGLMALTLWADANGIIR